MKITKSQLKQIIKEGETHIFEDYADIVQAYEKGAPDTPERRAAQARAAKFRETDAAAKQAMRDFEDAEGIPRGYGGMKKHMSPEEFEKYLLSTAKNQGWKRHGTSSFKTPLEYLNALEDHKTRRPPAKTDWEKKAQVADDQMIRFGKREPGDPYPIIWYHGPRGQGSGQAPPRKPGEVRYYHPDIATSGFISAWPDPRTDSSGTPNISAGLWSGEAIKKFDKVKWKEQVNSVTSTTVGMNALAIVYELKEEQQKYDPKGNFKGPRGEVLHDYDEGTLINAIEQKAAEMSTKRTISAPRGGMLYNYAKQAAKEMITNWTQQY